MSVPAAMLPRPILKLHVASASTDRPSKRVRFELVEDSVSSKHIKQWNKKSHHVNETIVDFEAIQARSPMAEFTNRNDQNISRANTQIPSDFDQKENFEVTANHGVQGHPNEKDGQMRWGRPGSKRAAFLAALSTVLKVVFKQKPCTDSAQLEESSSQASNVVESEKNQPAIVMDKPKTPASQADDDDEADTHASQGNIHFRRGDFLAALRCYNAAIENREDSYLVRSNRSACLHQLGRHHEALRDARIAVLKAPGLPTGRCRKAAALAALGDLSAARREYAAALSAAPNDPLVLRALAEVDALLSRERALRRAAGDSEAAAPPAPAAAAAVEADGAVVDLAREELDLRGQALGDEGVRRLSDSLAANATVRRLWLDSNAVADAGATALARALRRNRTLALLGLNGNDIGDAGATALAAALPANQGLQEVLLEGNRVGLAGGEALARALEANPRVRRLALGHNRILADDSGGGGAGGAPGRVSLRECADGPSPWLRACAPGGGGGGGGGADGDVGCSAGCGTRLLACAAEGGSCDPLWRPGRGCRG